MSVDVQNRAGQVPATPDYGQMIEDGFSKISEALGSRQGEPTPATPSGATEPEPTPASDDTETNQDGPDPNSPEPAMAALQPLVDGVRGAVEGLVGQVTDLSERMDGFEVHRGGRAPAVVTSRKSLALVTALTETHEYKQYWSRGDPHNGVKADKLPSVLLEELEMYERMEETGQRETVMGSDELGDLVAPYRRPGMITYLQDEHGLWDFLNKQPVTSEKVEITKETEASEYGYTFTTLAAALTGGTTPTNVCTVNNAEGIEAGMFVRFVLASATHRRKIVGVNKTTKVLTFDTDTIDFDAPIDSKVCVEGIGATAEKGKKPYGFLEAVAKTESLKTIATMLGITVQRMRYLPRLERWMRTKLKDRVKKVYAWHCLYGDGSLDGQLAGFFTDPACQTFVWSTDGELGDTRLDALLKAAAMIPGGGPIGLVLNSDDWLKTVLTKGDDGHYVSREFGPVRIIDQGPGRRWLGGYPVGIEDILVPGDALAANFKKAHELFINPRLAAFALGMINDDFETNKRRARYEEASLNSIQRTQAYTQITLDQKPT